MQAKAPYDFICKEGRLPVNLILLGLHSTKVEHSSDGFVLHQMKRSTKLLEQSMSAVKAAARKMSVMAGELESRGATVVRLQEELDTATTELKITRDRANRLQSRFDQVWIALGKRSRRSSGSPRTKKYLLDILQVQCAL